MKQSLRCRRFRLWPLLALCGTSLLLATAPRSTPPNCDGEIPADHEQATYYYRMKGKIRPFLFFWIGKDNVGGGTISFEGVPARNRESWASGVQVLFGSIPERVPGHINRWGYAQEWAYWNRGGNGECRRLERSVFEGFMRHSNEESISQVQSRDKQEKNKSLYWYDGTRSTVLPRGAHSEIRYFSAEEDFDFREPRPLQQQYRRRLAGSPPDKSRRLENRRHLYGPPYGFLTAVRETLRELSESFKKGPTRSWRRLRPVRMYVYNSKPYRLRVRHLKHHRRFMLRTGKEKGKGRPFRDVAEVDFRVTNLRRRSTHDFSLWVPLKGKLEGVPLRIEDRPRWWLRIELNLALGEKIPEGLPTGLAFGPEFSQTDR